MPWNGSGSWSAPSLPGSFNPAVTGQTATAADWNTFLADLSAAFSNVICADGQSTVTANIPMAGYKLTGVGSATALTDAVAATQVVNNKLNGQVDSGAADAYVISPTIAIGSYAAYQRFQFKATNANTGAATLNVSGLGVKSIKNIDGTALAANQILAGSLVDVMYDGTNFVLLAGGNLPLIAGGTVGPLTVNGALGVSGTLSMSAHAINEAVRVDVASASTCDIGAAVSNYVRITGTTTITNLGTIASGVRRQVVFAGALVLTYNATSLILPTSANITTAAGDCALFESEGSGNWRCVDYQRADGSALYAAPVPTKAWCIFDGTAGSPSVTAGLNVTSITKNGTGDYTITFTSALTDANYALSGSVNSTIGITGSVDVNSNTSPTASAVRIVTSANNAATDFSRVSVVITR